MPAMKIILALLWLLPALSVSALAAPFQTKMDVRDLGTLVTGRPAKINVWYPAGACPENSAQLCLADGAATNKVVVFSHGAMGSADNYSWLGAGLAAAGFVVVAVNHYGESSVYGDATQDMRSSAFIWQRAQEISALTAKLAGEKLFQRDVDWNSIVAIGHSAGGQTAAMLAGAQFDVRRIAPYCDSESAKADLSCNYSRNSANAPDQFVALFNANYQDTRVKKIVLIDPALGSGLQPDSLRAIALPSLVVGAAHNDFLPWENHAARYAAGIPNVQSITLGGQEGHFVFITPCRHDARVMGVPLCQDRPGVDRVAVQQDLTQRIVDFVKVDNEPAMVERQPGAVSGPGARIVHSTGFFQILLYTPTWVFVLLASLIVFGLMQARTRRVAVWLTLLLPAAMPILSLSGVLQYVGVSILVLSAWALGLCAAAMLCLHGMNPTTARYDSQSRKLIVAGSWAPLLVILAIFFVRYAIAVSFAMQFEIVRDPIAQLTVSLVLGAFSGFFVARGMAFWRVRARALALSPS